MFSDGKFPAFLLIAGVAAPKGLKNTLPIRARRSNFSYWDFVNNIVCRVEQNLC